ncbi:tRNA (N6-isopentenyl adenosine(37)-C2)-methylthiotransferase MiaB [Eubacteriales bacterium OttesenSCG-928-M02]|nr:tRNA (N6-isopentenyl adenosine(37)-C2)-methylthiotransferase MiaB [Eubacteriales bacterium OttesenSCG-928-M02]
MNKLDNGLGGNMNQRENALWNERKGTYYIMTFGCQMNVRDSQTAAGILEEMGYERAGGMETADVILFNTCCIRDMAERKAYGAIGRTKAIKEARPGTIVGVFGCMTEQEGVAVDLKKRMLYVDFAFGTHNLHNLPAYITLAESGRWEEMVADDGGAQAEFLLPSAPDKPPLGYINIIHGCNNFCSFCIVPYVRGREISKPLDLIVQEAERLLEQGYKEIMLLGQNVNSYGTDKGAHGFHTLLRALDKLGVPRIRFMTSHPKDLTEEMIEAMADCGHVMEQIHLPVQSGNDRILQRMNRKYTVQTYLEHVEKLRRAMPEVGITTDIIVGFPGETAAEFEDTLALVEKVKFDAAFTFNFSPRKGTVAAQWEDDVIKEEKTQRIILLIDRIKQHTMELHRGMVGQEYEVLIEGPSQRNEEHMTGKTRRGRTINFNKGRGQVGDIVPVKVIRAYANTLFGEEVE